MVSPVRGNHRRFQAETPLIALFKFAEPALISMLGLLHHGERLTSFEELTHLGACSASNFGKSRRSMPTAKPRPNG
jgi:hypothetical protein